LSDKDLRLVHSYLQSYLEKKRVDDLSPAARVHLKYTGSGRGPGLGRVFESNLALMQESDYEKFLIEIELAREWPSNLPAFLKAIWPPSDVMADVHKRNIDLHKALHSFELDFFRDKNPIFDVVILNHSKGEMVIHSASLEMRNVQVRIEPPVQAGEPHTLPVVAEYDWRLINLEDQGFTAWLTPLRERGRKMGHASGVYKDKLQASQFELDPPAVAPAGQPVRIRIRFTGGYSWPCEIRFSFFSGKENRADSDWFQFQPE
jgi:hypothetical protein